MQYSPWQQTCSTGLAPLQRLILDEEARTRLIRTWQPDVMIGLLQTEAYARAILRACISVLGVPSDLDDVVATRMRRQRILDQDGHEFRFLIGEWVMRRTVGSHAVMVDQLTHLLEVMASPRIGLGIVPLDADYRVPAAGFVVHDESEASAEAVGGEIVVKDAEGIALHLKTFDILAEQALYGDEARQLIRTALAMHRA
ncbi:DUF5753 domain-containing protein [Nocardia yamanashiensis]|uniref:DUF5753 domain-containing protein n=1 Tax=Nocardia yamanashiensis TaxID=209247 RepID=UPI001E43BA62|nr:DUF5753 domain-containing protein [Nocardia yamanashiensis]UGT44826.1 DUF5753 domain-containing protein [Nocardia yamanashiensis]